MFRLNIVLLILTVICALSLVTTQHKARHYYAELEIEKKKTQDLEVEYGRLILEESTWRMSARIEEIAMDRLNMERPAKGQIETIILDRSISLRNQP